MAACKEGGKDERKILYVRIPAEIDRAIERRAASDDRSKSSVVTIALREWLRDHGYLPFPEVEVEA